MNIKHVSWTKLKSRFQKGISLLEVMLSLSIIAIILVMATRYFFTASNSQRMNEARAQVGVLTALIHSWKANHSDYSTITTSVIASNLVGDSSWNGTVLKSPWNTQVAITVAPSSAESYMIAFDMPDATLCSTLRSSFHPQAASSAEEGVSCDGVTFQYVGPIVKSAST